MDETTATAPIAGYIWLILIPVPESPPGLYLNIPTFKLPTLCIRPMKLLRFFAYAILGLEGCIRCNGNVVQDDEGVEDGAVYEFERSDSSSVFTEYIVDLEAVRRESSLHTGASRASRQGDFRSKLLERDMLDVFAGYPADPGDEITAQGLHIIPFAQGDEWIQHIIKARPAETDDDLSDLTSIDVIRNGFLSGINNVFDHQRCVVLVTPNKILDRNDIPQRFERVLTEGTAYPRDKRFTLQNLAGLQNYAHNTDAAFSSSSSSPRPSETLLLYHYGASLLMKWGRGKKYLEGVSYRRPPRPPPPRRRIIGHDAHGYRDDEDEGDVSDLILAFWERTPVARERRRQRESEFDSRMQHWVQNVEQPVQDVEREESTA